MVFIFVGTGGGPIQWIGMLLMVLSVVGIEVDETTWIGLSTLMLLGVGGVAWLRPSFLGSIRRWMFGNVEEEGTDGRNASDSWTNVSDRVRRTPIETHVDDLRELSTGELKTRLRRRGVDDRGCVEKNDLVDLLREKLTENCIICFEDYVEGDSLRVLTTCGHAFHLECIDRWAYVAADKRLRAECPLCKKPI